MLFIPVKLRMPVREHYRPAPRFLTLNKGYADPVEAARFPQQILRYRNDRWAARVGLAGLTEQEWATYFARLEPLPDNIPEPLAMRYHGHQFLTYNPEIGDGRGFLHAQLLDDRDRLLDLGTKGSGTTPYSRGGDGRLTLKGGVREVLATEMLEALGVDTSKSFSLFETGEALMRHDEPSPTRSSLLVRLSHSHIRFGTFQRLAHTRQLDHLRRLVDYAIEHYLPQAKDHPDGPLVGFIDAVAARSVDMAASIMAVGFVHGVLNTDNMNITGEVFDYGPYRFLPTYDSKFVAAYFDHSGLYAFGRQPHAVLWNLAQLADAIQSIETEVSLAKPLDQFRDHFASAFLRRFLLRLGVEPQGEDGDVQLAEAVFTFLETAEIGYDRFFFDWYGGTARAEQADDGPAASAYAQDSFRSVRRELERYRPLISLEHPYFQRNSPCTLLIEEIEHIWSAIADHDNWAPFNDKIADIRTMGEAMGSYAPSDV